VAAPTAARKDSGARFAGLSGQIEIHYPDEAKDVWHLVKPETVIPEEAHIRTDEDSNAIIGFADMSTFEMKPGTEIVVSTPPQKDSKIALVAGNIWANIKKIAKDGSMEVEMNQAVAGIKGTTFVVSDIGGVSTLKVIEGRVDFTGRADGKTVQVGAGETAAATAAGTGPVGKFDAVAEQKDWTALRTRLETSSSGTATVGFGSLWAERSSRWREDSWSGCGRRRDTKSEAELRLPMNW